MSLLSIIGSALEKAGISIFSKETVNLFCEMSDESAYLSLITAVEFALELRHVDFCDGFLASRLLLEPNLFNHEDRMTIYRVLQTNYWQGKKI